MLKEIDPLKDLFNGKRSRRTSAEIICDILSAAQSGERKTRIMFKCNLNPAVMQKYLNFLIKRGLIKKSGKEYTTTVEGAKFINCLEELAELKQRMGQVEEKLSGLLAISRVKE
jgi:predicted transcriptional regulator